MIQTLATVIRDNWEWRDKIAKLSWYELVKKSRGTVLSWAWFVVQPLIYLFCFWFALEIGLRAGRTSLSGDAPYLLWLAAGIFSWFFMKDILGPGSNVYHKFSYLVTKIKFPLAAIPTINTGATMLVQFILVAILLGLSFAYGIAPDIYLLQVPLALVLMFVFWNAFSTLASMVTAFSKDVANLIQALTTPLFWLSGVIFDVKGIDIPAVQVFLDYNPITFFVEVMRCGVCYKQWFWDDTGMLVGFAVVFVVTVVLALLAYRNLNKEVSDVL